MSYPSKQPHRQLRDLVTPRTAAAAIPNWLFAVGFLVLLKAEVLGPSIKLPGLRLLHGWALVEAIAIWTVPALYAAHRVWGKRVVFVSVCNAVPTLIAVLFASGYLSRSVKFFLPAYVLVFVYNKCLAFFFSCDSHAMRGAVMVRVFVGVATCFVSVVLSALIFVFVFTPLRLQEAGLIPAMLLLSGAFYFAALGVLELVLTAQPPIPSNEDVYEPYPESDVEYQ